MRLGKELRNPWGMLIGGVAGGLGWAVGVPVAAAAGIGAAVWAVRGLAEVVFNRGVPDDGSSSAIFDPDGVRRELARLRSKIKGKVPDDILQQVDAISETIGTILPRASSLGPGSQDLFVLARTATDYLPTAIDAYVSLPRDYAMEHPISGGKTAHQVLAEQLDLLRAQMDEIAIAVNKNDTDKLLAHGRFLEERFGRKDLSLGQGDEGSTKPT